MDLCNPLSGMRRSRGLCIPACIFLLASGGAAFGQAKSDENTLDLYPEIEPYQTGYLKVSDMHEIFYELCGNPEGKPVMILHGGPGGGCYPALRRYHDPEKYLIILHDQRGAGRSKPYGELRENTTPNLVEDIEKLRKHLKLGKVQVFGGSWGSTLGLAYAETYPGSVSSLVIRGVFAGTQAEIDHFYHGGVAYYYPEIYERLQAIMPHPERHDYPAQLLEMLRSEDPEIRNKASKGWAAYEMRVAQLEENDGHVAEMLQRWDPYDFSLLENHYMVNRCFLKEGQLLENAGKLTGFPTFIVQGRYDVICPPITAYKMHQVIPGSKLIITEACGHSGGEPRTRTALIEITRKLGR